MRSGLATPIPCTTTPSLRGQLALGVLSQAAPIQPLFFWALRHPTSQKGPPWWALSSGCASAGRCTQTKGSASSGSWCGSRTIDRLGGDVVELRGRITGQDGTTTVGAKGRVLVTSQL